MQWIPAPFPGMAEKFECVHKVRGREDQVQAGYLYTHIFFIISLL
jgi:hypothetical protein